MADENSSNVWQLVLVGGGSALITAAGGQLYQFYKTWNDSRQANAGIDRQLRKEGFEAVIIRQDAQIKQLQADRESLVADVVKLRDAETDCRIQQANISADLKIALSRFETACKRIDELESKVRTLEGDSKTREDHRTIVQPGAVHIDARDSGINLGENMTDEQKAKAEERIERRKPQ